MKNIGTIASLVIKEELRRKVIIVFVLISCLVILTFKLFTSITPGAEKQFIIDMSFTWINVIGILLVVLIAADAVSKEERENTDYFYRTNPVSAADLILGKLLGAFQSVILPVTAIQIFYFLFFWVSFHQFSFEHIKGFILLDFKLFLLCSVGLFASCVFSRFVSLIFTISVYFTGAMSSYVAHLAEHHHDAQEITSIYNKISMFLYHHLPNFERFDISEYLIVEIPVESGVFWGAIRYGIISSLVVTFSTIILWRIRDKLR